MTGPSVPRPNPAPGSNAIGKFIIGVSPIGTIIPFDYWNTILSQYANSATLTALIGDFDAWLDQTQNFDLFFDSIWNVNTAQGVGLDVWGRIVNVSRTLTVQAGSFFDFEESGVSGTTFGQAPFYSGGGITSNYQLSDSAYRQLIFAKALANISDGSIPSINQILLALFPNRGNCYVADGNNMTLAYTFNFSLSPVEAAIVSSSGVLPKPVGVLASVVQIG